MSPLSAAVSGSLIPQIILPSTGPLFLLQGVGYPEIPQLRDVQTSSEDSLAGDTMEERSRALLHDWLNRPGEDDDFVMPGWDEDYHYSC